MTKHKKQLKSSQMSVDAKTEDLASQEKISGSPANLTRTSMLSGTVVKSVPSEKAAETVIDQSSGCDLASSDGMYVTAKKYTNRVFEIVFLRDVEGNFNEEHGFASSTQIYSGGYFPEFFQHQKYHLLSLKLSMKLVNIYDNLFYAQLLTSSFFIPSEKTANYPTTMQ